MSLDESFDLYNVMEWGVDHIRCGGVQMLSNATMLITQELCVIYEPCGHFNDDHDLSVSGFEYLSKVTFVQ